MYQRYKDQVTFLAVYVREAHPTDGWRATGNDKVGISFAQPRNLTERNRVAQQCSSTLEITMPLLVDTMDDRVGHAYSGMPDRMYVIDRTGKVAYQGGRGPFGFKVGEMEQSLILVMLEDARAKTPPLRPPVTRVAPAAPAAPKPAPKAPVAPKAPPATPPRVPPLEQNEALKRLPKLEKPISQSLPLWARMLAGSLPQTTAAMLELDYLHRARSPLNRLVRGKIRWVAAQANGCAYTRAEAEADLTRAGLAAKDLQALKGDWGKLAEEDQAILTFARKMTVAAHSVTDEEAERLISRRGEKQVVAVVLLLAYANFQDRLLLTLGITPEQEGPAAPLEIHFAKNTNVLVPSRKTPSAAETFQASLDPDWFQAKFVDLQERLNQQRARKPRIRVPAWEEVRSSLPAGAKLKKPLQIRWSLVCLGYQPELANAWSACTRAFGREAAMDRVLEESIFWVVTRTLSCFY